MSAPTGTNFHADGAGFSGEIRLHGHITFPSGGFSAVRNDVRNALISRRLWAESLRRDKVIPLPMDNHFVIVVPECNIGVVANALRFGENTILDKYKL
jgi:hypothetical protein